MRNFTQTEPLSTLSPLLFGIEFLFKFILEVISLLFTCKVKCSIEFL